MWAKQQTVCWKPALLYTQLSSHPVHQCYKISLLFLQQNLPTHHSRTLLLRQSGRVGRLLEDLRLEHSYCFQIAALWWIIRLLVLQIPSVMWAIHLVLSFLQSVMFAVCRHMRLSPIFWSCLWLWVVVLKGEVIAHHVLILSDSAPSCCTHVHCCITNTSYTNAITAEQAREFVATKQIFKANNKLYSHNIFNNSAFLKTKKDNVFFFSFFFHV